MTDHRYPKEAIRAALAILDEAGVEPTTFRASWGVDRDPDVSLTFECLKDLQAFAGADGAKLSASDKSNRGGRVTDHYAVYERPGRRMLAQFIETGPPS